jgi:hypothetical protein
MTKESDIRTAYYDNLRNNQIGGKTDGIDPKVAEDIGYESPEQVARIIRNAAENIGEMAVGMPDSVREQIDELRGRRTPQTPTSIRQEVINARIKRNQ